MIRSILVPLDGSTFGEHALPLAVSIARHAPAHVQLVHVHQAVPPTTIGGVVIMDDLELSMRQEEKHYLDAQVRRLMDEAGVSAGASLLEGDVAAAVHERATLSACDLVVLCTHGRGALGRLWLGSVADELVRRLPMPILLVRPDESPVRLDQPPALQRILLPLDGTPLAEQMIKPALEVGSLMGATFTLVRVIEPAIRFDYAPFGATLEQSTTQLLDRAAARQKELHHEAVVYLDRVARDLRADGLKVETCVVTDEQPALGILREADAHHADMIAIETHGRRGLSRWLMGSVADKVVRGGNLPVLLHRPTAA